WRRRAMGFPAELGRALRLAALPRCRQRLRVRQQRLRRTERRHRLPPALALFGLRAGLAYHFGPLRDFGAYVFGRLRERRRRGLEGERVEARAHVGTTDPF